MHPHCVSVRRAVGANVRQGGDRGVGGETRLCLVDERLANAHATFCLCRYRCKRTTAAQSKATVVLTFAFPSVTHPPVSGSAPVPCQGPDDCVCRVLPEGMGVLRLAGDRDVQLGQRHPGLYSSPGQHYPPCSSIAHADHHRVLGIHGAPPEGSDIARRKPGARPEVGCMFNMQMNDFCFCCDRYSQPCNRPKG